MLHPKDKLGFQPGVPKKILLEVFLFLIFTLFYIFFFLKIQQAFKKYETIASRMNEKLIKQYQGIQQIFKLC